MNGMFLRYASLDCDARFVPALLRRQCAGAGFDDPTAKANVSVVDHQILSRRRRPLRRVKCDAPTSTGDRLEPAWRIGHPIARFRGEFASRLRQNVAYPMHGPGLDCVRVEAGVVVSLDDDERVSRRVLGRDEPRQVAAFPRAANTDPLPLAERVVRETLMMTDNAAFGRHYRPALF